MENFSEQDIAKFMAFMRKQQAEETVRETSATITESPELKDQATDFQTNIDRGEDQEDLDFNLKNDFLIEERLRSLISHGKFVEAISVFESMECVDYADVGLKLLIAECYIQLGRENKAEKTVKDIEKILMQPPMCDVSDVMALANDFYNNSNCVRALLLLRIAGDMYYNNSSLSPDDKTGRIFSCISKIDDVVDQMVKLPPDETEDVQNIKAIQRALGMDSDTGLDASKNIGKKKTKKIPEISERTRVMSLDYGVEVMEEMLGKILSINGGDPEFKALKLARAANFVNSQYRTPAQFSKAVKVMKFGIEQLEKQFGKNARQYRIYGTMLATIGVDFHNSEKYKEAETYKLRALEAKENALDFENEEKKRKSIRKTQESLRVTQSHFKFVS